MTRKVQPSSVCMIYCIAGLGRAVAVWQADLIQLSFAGFAQLASAARRPKVMVNGSLTSSLTKARGLHLRGQLPSLQLQRHSMGIRHARADHLHAKESRAEMKTQHR